MKNAKRIISISFAVILLFVSCFSSHFISRAQQEDTEVTKIHIRHDSGRLLLFLSVNDYADKAATQIAGDKVSEYNVFDNIYLYKSDSEYQVLRDLIDDKTYYNIWSEYGCIAFDMADGWDGTTIKKVVIKAGCEFPSYAYTNNGGTEKGGYVVQKDVTYITNSSKVDNTDWIKEAVLVKEDTEVFGIKTGHNEQIITFTLTNSDYEGLANEWVANSHLSYNYMSQIKLYTSDTEYVTLGEAYKNQIYYCMWTEKNTLSIQVEKTVFDQIVKIEIPEDTSFPSYEYTNNGGEDKVGYTITEKQVFRKPTMPTQGQIYDWILVKEREEIDTRIANVHVRYANGGKLIVFLDTHDYPENVGTTVIDCLDEYDILDHILLYRGDEMKSLAEVWAGGEKYYNIWDERGCVAFSLADGWNGETITKVVVQEGCQFPSYEYTTQGGKKLKTYVAKYETEFLATEKAEQNTSFEKQEHITTIAVDALVREAKLLGTKGDVRLVLTLSDKEYENVEANAPLSLKFKEFNTLSHVILYSNGKAYTLEELINEEEVYCNLWGTENTISFGLNGSYTTESFEKVEIKDGCELSSYIYASTDSDEKIAYVMQQGKTFENLLEMNKVTYYDEDGKVLYEDQVACGSPLNLRTAQKKEGYSSSWEGIYYDVMPTQDISYTVSYEKNEEKVSEKEDDILEEEELEKEELEEEEYKSPATGDQMPGAAMPMCLMVISLAVILMDRRVIWRTRRKYQ